MKRAVLIFVTVLVLFLLTGCRQPQEKVSPHAQPSSNSESQTSSTYFMKIDPDAPKELNNYSLQTAILCVDVIFDQGVTHQLMNQARLDDFMQHFKDKRDDFVRLTYIYIDSDKRFEFGPIRDVYYQNGRITVIEYDVYTNGVPRYPATSPEYYDEIYLQDIANSTYRNVYVKNAGDTEPLKIFQFDTSHAVAQIDY